MEPNKYGVYPDSETILVPCKVAKIEILLCEIQPGAWCSTARVRHGSGGWSGPIMKRNGLHPTRDAAIRNQVAEEIRKFSRPDTHDTRIAKRALTDYLESLSADAVGTLFD